MHSIHPRSRFDFHLITITQANPYLTEKSMLKLSKNIESQHWRLYQNS